MSNEYVLDVLRLFQFEFCDELFWRADYPEPGHFFISVNCSDVFYWGTADTEEITIEDVPALQADFEKQRELQGTPYPDYFYMPWIARKRGIRPQGAMYKYLPEAVVNQINEEIPEREIDVLNPFTEDNEYKYENI